MAQKRTRILIGCVTVTVIKGRGLKIPKFFVTSNVNDPQRGGMIRPERATTDVDNGAIPLPPAETGSGSPPTLVQRLKRKKKGHNRFV